LPSATQEQRGIDNLVSFAQAAERDLFDEVSASLPPACFAHSYIDKSGRDGVHGYVSAAQLAC